MQMLAILSAVIGVVVRLLKSDTKIPIDIPAKYRPLAALALGPVVGVIDMVVGGGSTWHAAGVAVAAPLLAMASHQLCIETLRGGEEIPVPLLMKPPAE